MSKGLTSILIRTHNEEQWIGHCLDSVFTQDYNNDKEVIIIDNKSEDNTLKIIGRYPVKKVLSIGNYLPGKSLNRGIEQSKGEYIVCLSSHCVPKNNQWLRMLIKNFKVKNVAGVYGRQVPVSFSNPADVRDLYITFGLEKRVQKKDSFFHNANSAIRRSVVDKFPFDDQVTNIEDRLWAKTVIDNGYNIIYEPDAEVYHHHGIHHHQNIKRISQTFMVLNEHKTFSVKDLLPESMKPENRSIACIVPIPQKTSNLLDTQDFISFFSEIKSSKYIKSVHILFDDPLLLDICERFEFNMIKRPNTINLPDVTLEMILKWSLEKIEDNGFEPDIIIFANPIYPYRPKRLFDELIQDICYKGLDTVFAGFLDYQIYWAYNEEKGYHQVGEGILPRKDKHPIYKSLFGLGCVSTSQIIRKGQLVGENVGIIPVDDLMFSLKRNDPSSRKIISILNDNNG